MRIVTDTKNGKAVLKLEAPERNAIVIARQMCETIVSITVKDESHELRKPAMQLVRPLDAMIAYVEAQSGAKKEAAKTEKAGG